MEINETENIEDEKGFIYIINISHDPGKGISEAFYNNELIASREYGKWTIPYNDDDCEWEQFFERFEDFACEIQQDLKLKCKEYFNNKYKKL